MSTNYMFHFNVCRCCRLNVESAIHIGKRSMGHVFLWHALSAEELNWCDSLTSAEKERGLECAANWRGMLLAHQDSGQVLDEYNRHMPVPEFLLMVEEWNRDYRANFEEKQRAAKGFWGRPVVLRREFVDAEGEHFRRGEFE